jgi:hypothetical protein
VRLHRTSARNISVQPFGKLSLVVRVDLCVVPSTGYSDVCQPAIDEPFSSLGRVNLEKNSVGSLSLTAVARHRVAVIEMLGISTEGTIILAV